MGDPGKGELGREKRDLAGQSDRCMHRYAIYDRTPRNIDPRVERKSETKRCRHPHVHKITSDQTTVPPGFSSMIP